MDCDLLSRAYQASIPLVSTERLTVFKFNSAFRRDSYIRRDTTEQQEILARLIADPGRCVEEEWAGIMRASREYRLREHAMPDEWTGPPGAIHRANLRARGLEGPEISDLSEARRFNLDDQPSAMEWHGVEGNDEWGSFRWSGPSASAGLTLPVCVRSDYRVRLQLLNWLGVDVAQETTLFVAGQQVAFTARDVGWPAVQVEAFIPVRQGLSQPPPRANYRDSASVPLLRDGWHRVDTRWLGGWCQLGRSGASRGDIFLVKPRGSPGANPFRIGSVHPGRSVTRGDRMTPTRHPQQSGSPPKSV